MACQWEAQSPELTHDLKEAPARHATLVEAALKQQVGFLLPQVDAGQDEDAAREPVRRPPRQRSYRLERVQLEFGKTLRQREEEFEHQLKHRGQELTLGLDARLVEKETGIEQDARRRETELKRQIEARALEVDARWKQELQQREEAAQVRLKQREQQLQAQAEARIHVKSKRWP